MRNLILTCKIVQLLQNPGKMTKNKFPKPKITNTSRDPPPLFFSRVARRNFLKYLFRAKRREIVFAYPREARRKIFTYSREARRKFLFRSEPWAPPGPPWAPPQRSPQEEIKLIWDLWLQAMGPPPRAPLGPPLGPPWAPLSDPPKRKSN